MTYIKSDDLANYDVAIIDFYDKNHDTENGMCNLSHSLGNSTYFEIKSLARSISYLKFDNSQLMRLNFISEAFLCVWQMGISYAVYIMAK